MSDLISREALIEELNKYIRNGMIHKNDLAEVIVNQPSAQQWILCSERLPEGNRFYIATIEDEAETKVLEYEPIYKEWYDEEKWSYPVIAWMPLPEPYKGE